MLEVVIVSQIVSPAIVSQILNPASWTPDQWVLFLSFVGDALSGLAGIIGIAVAILALMAIL